MRTTWAALAIGAGLAAGACGKRGDPLPPVRRVPQPVTELRVAQRGSQLEVSLVAPRAAADNSRLPVIEIEILRAPAEGDFTKVAQPTLRKAAPGERLVEEEPLPPAGTILRFAARARLQGRASSLTPIESLTVGPMPPAPSDLVVKSVPKGVGLEWTAPTTPEPPPAPLAAAPEPSPIPEASPMAPSPASETPPPASESAGAVPPVPGGPSAAPSFFVYRRSERGAFGPPLVTAPILGPAFVDETARADDRWCYVARNVASTSPLIESEASNEACLTVADVAPPEAPVGLAARETDEGVEVTWSPSGEEDLKLYRLYRGAGEGPGKRIADIPGGTTTYVDTAAPRGVLVHYTLTALDAAGNESPRSSPAAALRP